MMRIIAGDLGGRFFEAPKGHITHPMSTKARSAIFNCLGDITDLTVLDAYAGSGALSFEAISRGVSSVLAIENDTKAIKTLRSNIDSLQLKQKINIFPSDIKRWFSQDNGALYDIVFVDPPYHNIDQDILVKLSQKVRSQGLIIYSLPVKYHQFSLPDIQFTRLKIKNYGDAELHYFRHFQTSLIYEK